MSILVSFSMFYLSFAPLWLSVLFLDGKSLWEHAPHPYTELISIVLILVTSAASFVLLLRSFSPKHSHRAEAFTLIAAKEEKDITAEFLLAYILPLSAFDFTIWSEVFLFLIFFVIFTVLCLRHNRFTVNIVLEFLGYRIYSCELENRDRISTSKMILTKSLLSAELGSTLHLSAINNDIWVHIGSS